MAVEIDKPRGLSPQESDPWLQPWQFFLLGGMLAATATVIVATGQSPANIIILSLTVVSVSFVGLGAYHLLLPLVTKDLEPPPTIAGRTRAALEREKTLVLRSIKELEFDHAMGKVAKADFDEMSGRLRARAAGLIRQLDAGGGYKEQIAKEVEQRLARSEGDGLSRRQNDETDEETAATETATTETATANAVALRTSESECSKCGTVNDEDAKFCKNCGHRLDACGHRLDAD
jgi:hypothetical protein